MAIKTDAEIGAKIRVDISSVELKVNETIEKVRVILVPEIKNSDTGAVFSRGGKGFELNKYNLDDEELNDSW